MAKKKVKKCWKGYKRVKGMKAGTKGSYSKTGRKKKTKRK